MLLHIVHCVLAVFCCLLAIGYCLLAIGYCLLPIVYWLLAIGYWLLAIVYCLIRRPFKKRQGGGGCVCGAPAGQCRQQEFQSPAQPANTGNCLFWRPPPYLLCRGLKLPLEARGGWS
jgi:hypothetical protein